MAPTLVTFLWRGWRPVYDYRHVNALGRMLRAHSPQLKLVCVTDMPRGITECETHPLWPSPIQTRPGERNCFTRLRLFDPKIGQKFGPWVCNIDLDCVLFDDITPLFDTKNAFKALRGIANPVNGSLWLLKVGTHAEVWADFARNPILAQQRIRNARYRGKPLVGSDQCWLSLKIPRPATWWVEDGVQQLSLYEPSQPPARILFCAGKHKPWEPACQQKHPLAYATYMAAFNRSPVAGRV